VDSGQALASCDLDESTHGTEDHLPGLSDLESQGQSYNAGSGIVYPILIARNDSKVCIEIAAASRARALENKKDRRISIAIAKASRAIAVECYPRPASPDASHHWDVVGLAQVHDGERTGTTKRC
jgi:hypothetical protein